MIDTLINALRTSLYAAKHLEWEDRRGESLQDFERRFEYISTLRSAVSRTFNLCADTSIGPELKDVMLSAAELFFKLSLHEDAEETYRFVLSNHKATTSHSHEQFGDAFVALAKISMGKQHKSNEVHHLY